MPIPSTRTTSATTDCSRVFMGTDPGGMARDAEREVHRLRVFYRIVRGTAGEGSRRMGCGGAGAGTGRGNPGPTFELEGRGFPARLKTVFEAHLGFGRRLRTPRSRPPVRAVRSRSPRSRVGSAAIVPATAAA